jgi:hypothetical protein
MKKQKNYSRTNPISQDVKRKQMDRTPNLEKGIFQDLPGRSKGKDPQLGLGLGQGNTSTRNVGDRHLQDNLGWEKRSPPRVSFPQEAQTLEHSIQSKAMHQNARASPTDNCGINTTVETAVLIEGRGNREVPPPPPVLDTPVQAINAITTFEVVEENEYMENTKAVPASPALDSQEEFPPLRSGNPGSSTSQRTRQKTPTRRED